MVSWRRSGKLHQGTDETEHAARISADSAFKGQGMFSCCSKASKSRVATVAIVLTAGFLGAPVARAAGISNAQVRRGERLAQDQCSACHIVAQNQEYPPLLRDPAPSFQSIANRTDTTDKSLRHFVMTTHWDLKTVPITMPNQDLSKTDASAVIQYILSLKSH
jgi:mono/diheme cytochrome c family protein